MVRTRFSLFHFASPAIFYPLAGRMQPVFMGLAVVLAAIGLYVGLLVAPTDAQQGEGYRIIFVAPCRCAGNATPLPHRRAVPRLRQELRNTRPQEPC